jgi:hypothetical protein
MELLIAQIMPDEAAKTILICIGYLYVADSECWQTGKFIW